MNTLALEVEELESLEAPSWWGSALSFGLGVGAGFGFVAIGIWVT